jgi:hypothetical protein
MPHQYRREVELILRDGLSPIPRDVQEIALELEGLVRDAEAGRHEALACLIQAALDEARRLNTGPGQG